jgi:transcription initiation factor TFIIB
MLADEGGETRTTGADAPVPAKSSLLMKIGCPECKNPNADVVEDYAAGDLICKECGLVLGDRIVDEHSEWRTFSNSDTPGSDPNRVGGPSNPLLRDSGLSTIIGKGDAAAASLSRWQNRGALNSGDRSLLNAFKEIGRMSDTIGLPQTIRDRANELYRQIDDQKSMRGRTADGIIAASLYIACRLEQVPRTFKEICALTKVSKKEIGRCYKFMLKVLETNLETITTQDFMNRFCSNLDLPMDVMKAATHVSKEAMRLGIVAGKSPISVAAAGIYMVSQLSSTKKTQKVIADIAGVSEVTIRNAYKDLYPYRHQLVPAGSEFLQNVNNLPAN